MPTRSEGDPEYQLDPELERHLRALRLERLRGLESVEDFIPLAMEERIGGRETLPQPPPRQLVRDFGNPGTYSMSGGIRVPQNRTNYQIHPHYIGLVKNDQFSGRKDECPLEHLDRFMETCQGAITNQVTPDYVYMTLFRHSLCSTAKMWFNDLTPDSLETWDEVVKEFLRKFYPAWKTAEARRNIATFEQDSEESLGEARERFRLMLRRCPHHGYDTGLRVRFFYDGLNPLSKQNLDSGAGGQVAKVPLEEAESVIDDICRTYSWEGRRKDRAVKSVRFDDGANLMDMVQASVEKALGKRQISMASAGSFSCEICGGTNHDRTYCGGADFDRVAAADYRDSSYHDSGNRGNSNSGWRNDGNRGGNNNSYWRENQNNQWGNQRNQWGNQGQQGNQWRDQGGSYSHRQDQREPPYQEASHGGYERNANRGGMYQHPNARGNNLLQNPSREMLPAPTQSDSMEILLQQMKALTQQVSNLDKRDKESQQHIKMLEKQLAQVAGEKAASSNTPLPAQTFPNPSGDHHPVHAITLRSGAQYEGPRLSEEKEKEDVRDDDENKDEMIEKEPENQKGEDAKKQGAESDEEKRARKARENRQKVEPRYEPPPPYPHRLVERKMGDKFNKFMEMMKGLQVNLPFLQAISQMPTYAKFLKDLLSNKSRMEEAELITLPHQISAMVERKMPHKYSDPGSFSLPVRLGDLEPLGALADLGAGVSLMPLSVARQLNFDITPSRKTIQLADRSIRVPYGQLIDVPIRVGNLVVPCDFIIMDMEPDPITPLILGREALKTLGAVVNCRNDTITLQVADEKIVFEFSKMVKRPMVEKNSVCGVRVIDDDIRDVECRLGLGEVLLEEMSDEDIDKQMAEMDFWTHP